MRVTITGATGTLGLAAARMALRAGHEVQAFVRQAERFRQLCGDERIAIAAGDILDRAAVGEALTGADAVIHCVGFAPADHLLHWDAARHALEGLRAGGQFVFPGNGWAFGPPQADRVGPEHPKASPARLGAVRADLEKAILAEGGTVVHLAEVYGPQVTKGVHFRTFQRALAGRRVWYPARLDRPIELLQIEDAARALIAPLGRRESRGREYTAGGYSTTTPRQFIQLIFQAAGQPPRLSSLPIRALRLRLSLDARRRLLRELFYLYELPLLLDGTRIRNELGWLPEIEYREGVRRTIRWLRGWRQRQPAPSPRAAQRPEADEATAEDEDPESGADYTAASA